MLTWIVCLPLMAALLLVLIPRNYRPVIRGVALLATLATLALATLLFLKFDAAAAGPGGYKFARQVPWVESLGISYHVGVDGINLGLIFMGAIVAFAAACVSWEIKSQEKEFYVLLLVMTGGILGAFASLDLFFFYFFHELALVPTFVMIGVWGRGENKNYATFKITLYLSFGVGYASAPTATAMLHAGVLKKFGLYGLLRVALPLMPQGAKEWVPVMAALCLGNILYCGWVAMRQRDLNRLIGNSSVAHVGFCFLGIASLNLIGVTGAVVVMVAHGLLAALTFGLSGFLAQQTGTLDMDKMGGLLRRLPFIGTALVMAMLAGCGVPGFANFAGELLVLFGAWRGMPWFVVLAAWGGLVVGAVYMLRAVRDILHGPLPERWAGIKDATLWRKVPFALLLAALLGLGCFPRLLTNKIKPSAAAILKMTTSGPGLAREDRQVDLVLKPNDQVLAGQTSRSGL